VSESSRCLVPCVWVMRTSFILDFLGRSWVDALTVHQKGGLEFVYRPKPNSRCTTTAASCYPFGAWKRLDCNPILPQTRPDGPAHVVRRSTGLSTTDTPTTSFPVHGVVDGRGRVKPRHPEAFRGRASAPSYLVPSGRYPSSSDTKYRILPKTGTTRGETAGETRAGGLGKGLVVDDMSTW
jgi:hypothetical protein